MDNIPAYIRRKHGQEAVTYLHPLLEPYLEKTYGIFVYQEDIMSAARALGGFTGPEADTLGYAIRKKKSSVLRAQKENFVTQAAERGVSPAVIDAVFKAFEPFERYGFNKAHATCYGLIAYQTAYLKANYTVEYMASVLTAFRDNTEKVAAAIAECRRLGIEVRPPDVHRSDLDFTVEGDAIRFGLLAVKNVGQGAIESIIAAREADGPFRSLADLCAPDRPAPGQPARAGVADQGGGAGPASGHPAQLLDALDDAMAAGQAEQRDRSSGQTSLFDGGPSPRRSSGPSRRHRGAAARAPALGEGAAGPLPVRPPAGGAGEQLGRYVTAYSGELGEELDQQRVVVGGVVTGMRRVITKSKSTMGVATLEDLQGTLEVVVFPRSFEATASTWQDDAILLVAGRVDHKGDGSVLLADSVWTWEDALAQGEEAFARQVQSLDRGRRGGRDTGRWGPPAGPGGAGPGVPGPAGAAAGGGSNGARPGGNGNGREHAGTVRRAIPHVSPLRGVGLLGERVIDVPVGAGGAPAVRGMERAAGRPAAAELPEPSPYSDDEPPLPAEAERARARQAAAPTRAVEAPPGEALHLRFGSLSGEGLAEAFAGVREILRARPGQTPVILDVPLGDGRTQPMELRTRVAYDTELLAELDRRFAGTVLADLGAVTNQAVVGIVRTPGKQAASRSGATIQSARALFDQQRAGIVHLELPAADVGDRRVRERHHRPAARRDCGAARSPVARGARRARRTARAARASGGAPCGRGAAGRRTGRWPPRRTGHPAPARSGPAQPGARRRGSRARRRGAGSCPPRSARRSADPWSVRVWPRPGSPPRSRRIGSASVPPAADMQCRRPA